MRAAGLALSEIPGISWRAPACAAGAPVRPIQEEAMSPAIVITKSVALLVAVVARPVRGGRIR